MDSTPSAFIVTLFEGDFILGVGALVNSLQRFGFTGRVYAGYKGDLTGWTAKSVDCQTYRRYDVSEGLEIRFVKVESDWHLSNLKPEWILKFWDTWEPNAPAVFYFDPDIVIKCRWSYFEEWASYGVALCQEVVMRSMPDSHPLRQYWRRWAAARGWKSVREMHIPMNGGFVGVSKAERSMLELWRDMMIELDKELPLKAFGPEKRDYPFHMTDQDVLNIVAMTYPGELSIIGPEGMDFDPGGFTMSHATGKPKPWRKNFLKSALQGNPPSVSDRQWLANTTGAIRVLEPADLKYRQRSLKIGAALGRFFKRT